MFIYKSTHVNHILNTKAMPAWLNSPWFDHPVTRPVTLRYFNPAILVFGVIYIVIITVVNIVAVGYESSTVISPNFWDHTPKLYEKFLPNSTLLPQTHKCNGSIIKVNEGTSSQLPELTKSSRYY